MARTLKILRQCEAHQGLIIHNQYPQALASLRFGLPADPLGLPRERKQATGHLPGLVGICRCQSPTLGFPMSYRIILLDGKVGTVKAMGVRYEVGCRRTTE